MREPVPSVPAVPGPAPRPRRARPGTVTVLGGSVAALVTADALARAGRPVALHLPARGAGGGFVALRRDGRRLELGVRALELGYEDDPAEAPPLAAYDPGFGGHRAYTPLVRRWVQELVGDRLVPLPAPQLVLDGRRHPDVHFTVDLHGLPALLGPRRTARVARGAAAAIAQHGARGIAPDAHRDLTLASASLANHGTTFHETLIAPLADKFLADGARRTLATWRRKVWMPLFWPATLLEACRPDGPAFRPQRRFETVADTPGPEGPDGGPGAVVAALLARLRAADAVRIAPLEGRPAAALRPGTVVGLGLRDLDPAYAPERARSVLAWLEVPHDGPVPLVHVADPENPLARVSDSGPGRRDGTRVLCAELRHDTPKERIDADARRGLRDAGLLTAAALTTAPTVMTGAQPTFDAPTAATRDAHAAALARVRAAHPGVVLVGPATAPGADAFNEQVVAGLAAAEALTR
ncbi:hypothetical protein GKE82_14265 [Conexibacter sp. W3-3-2]|uniref:hypothetical protein n=1 Tax=Conexibacter sp. W3-3-2 TaxID=2675227 RepID=UPI0012B6D364|nr:hypothetical protein [Conexibacter sp. W3-3-2]MTD45419.1 hypothetical protein [Conexibacter sp. W3-3-2]